MSAENPAIAFVASKTGEAQAALASLRERYAEAPLDKAEIIVALGGDGFMLRTLHRHMAVNRPVYGMKLGTVGFLMNQFHADNLIERLARAQPTTLKPLVMQAVNDRELAVLDLKRLLNIPVAQPINLTTVIDGNASIAILTSLSDTTAVPDRAVLRSSELALRARREGVTIARADLLPTVSLSFTNGFQAFPPLGSGFPTTRGVAANAFCATGSSTTAKCQNGGWFTDRSMTATISWPIFDGMRARSNIDFARAQQRLAETQLQLSREGVAVEVARARAELNRARTVFDARQQNSANAKEAFQLASLRFDRGLSTQLEVSDAQLALLTAESTEARATFDVFLASAELARALGRPIPLPPTTSSSRSSDPGAPREP